MKRRWAGFTWGSLWLAIPASLLLAIAILAFGRRNNPLFVAAAVVAGIISLGVVAMGLVQEARVFWWTLRWSWWSRRMERWTARREAWQAQGRCVGCGYDLTGNESRVCPECGTKVEPSGQ